MVLGFSVLAEFLTSGSYCEDQKMRGDCISLPVHILLDLIFGILTAR